MKKCTKCGETKPRPEFKNSNSKKCKDGKFPWCKKCTKAYDKAWREQNAERLNAKRRAEYAANPEPTRAFMRERYWRDPEARRADTAEWREKNPEKRKVMSRAWYLNNVEDAKAATRARYFAKRDELLIYSRARSKEHYQKNKDQYYLRSAARRARKIGAGGSLTRGIRKKLFEEQGGLCVYCGVELGASPHLDHIVPLARGGAHSDDNVQLLCQQCNLSKGTKMPDEFLKHRELLSAAKT